MYQIGVTNCSYSDEVRFPPNVTTNNKRFQLVEMAIQNLLVVYIVDVVASDGFIVSFRTVLGKGNYYHIVWNSGMSIDILQEPLDTETVVS